MTHLQIPLKDVITNFQCMQEVLRGKLPEDSARVCDEYIKAGLNQLEEAPSAIPTFLDEKEPLFTLTTQYLNALFL